MSALHRDRKQYWHPMSLQRLPWERFSRVVTDIMQKRLTLIPLLPEDLPLQGADSLVCGRPRNWPWKVAKEWQHTAGKAEGFKSKM